MSRKHYSVDIVDNGLKIFDMLEEKIFDIILMDVQMPVMDGLSFVHAVRSDPSLDRLPMIMVTTKNDLPQVAEALEAGPMSTS